MFSESSFISLKQTRGEVGLIEGAAGLTQRGVLDAFSSANNQRN